MVKNKTIEYDVNHYVTRSEVKTCHGCGTSLDIHGKVIDVCEDVTWQVCRCLRCGDVSLIDL